MKRRIIVVTLAAILAMSLLVPMALAKAHHGKTHKSSTNVNANQAVAANQGVDLREDAGAWWQWVLEKPIPVNPVEGKYTAESPKCNGQHLSPSAGAVWFLAGTIDGSKVTRTCTAPAGEPLFFPIVTTFQGDVIGAGNEQDFRKQAHDSLDQILQGSTLFATVDGNPVSSERADSPLFSFTLPTDNIYEASPGDYHAVADGVWVSVPSLSKGTHTIHFGVDPPNGKPSFKQDNTYNLTVS